MDDGIHLDFKVKIKDDAVDKIEGFVDKVIYTIARKVLDGSYPTIPLSDKVNSGALRSSSMAYGVKGADAVYTIASPVYYAKYVWKMDDATTNWTTAGTGNKWFKKYYTKNKKIIINSAITENKLK